MVARDSRSLGLLTPARNPARPITRRPAIRQTRAPVLARSKASTQVEAEQTADGVATPAREPLQHSRRRPPTAAMPRSSHRAGRLLPRSSKGRKEQDGASGTSGSMWPLRNETVGSTQRVRSRRCLPTQHDHQRADAGDRQSSRCRQSHVCRSCIRLSLSSCGPPPQRR